MATEENKQYLSEYDHAVAVIRGGGSVIATIDGQDRIVDDVKKLPSRAAYAKGTPQEDEVKGQLQAQVAELQAQIASLQGNTASAPNGATEDADAAANAAAANTAANAPASNPAAGGKPKDKTPGA